MNKILSLIAVGLMAFAGAVSAQGYGYDRGYNTEEVMGRVVSIGRPIVEIVPVGRSCYNGYERYDRRHEYRHPPRQREHSSLNGGTVLGAIVGGAVGSQIGDGSGRDLAMIAGAGIGATVGNDINRRRNDDSRLEHRYRRNHHNRCEMQYDRRIVGYNYIAEYEGFRVRGQMNRRPYLGMRVPMLVEVRTAY